MEKCVSILAVSPACLVFLAACASIEPTDDLRESRAAVAHAEDAGAVRHASRELALAREKLKLGERWIAAGDYKPARWLLEQARVDAELAAVKAARARLAEGGDGRRQ